MLNVLEELHPSITDKNGMPVAFPKNKGDFAKLLMVNFDTHAGHLIWATKQGAANTNAKQQEPAGIEWNYQEKTQLGTIHSNHFILGVIM